MSEAMVANCEETQREQCVGLDYLSHTCCVCNKPFTPRQHSQLTCGALGCRFGRQRRAIRAEEHKDYVARQWERRRAKSLVNFLAQTLGSKARDKYKDIEKIVVDKAQVYCRCTQCGEPFVDSNNKPITSHFEFCGETLLASGDCKRVWLALRVPVKSTPKQYKISQPLDEERLANTKRVRAPKLLRMSRRKLNFCPQCREYVNQDHEHVGP